MDYKERIKQWCRDQSYSTDENLFVKRLRDELTDEQISHVLTVLDNTCHHCWDNNIECQCWNDE